MEDYIFIVPFLLRWLRPRPVVNNKSNTGIEQQQSDNETSSDVKEPSTINAEQSKKSNNTSILSTLYELINYTVSLPIPQYLLNGFVKPSKCPKDVSFHACSRLNESKCPKEDEKKKL